MKIKKEGLEWPAAYESPRIHHIKTAFQQALGITPCGPGINASGGAGSCSMGTDATGTPDDPNACAPGDQATVGPGHGTSPCGPGHSAMA